MKHKVSELEGAWLDAAVAMAAGHLGFTISEYDAPTRAFCHVNGRPFAPSAEWATGGPIIEREGIALLRIGGAGPIFWSAKMPHAPFDGEIYPNPSSTPLIAAMRAYVASKLGEEVDL